MYNFIRIKINNILRIKKSINLNTYSVSYIYNLNFTKI